ncbi:hypothetical protein C7H73_05600 [Pulveribacter suum]|uniref:Uncharacterized protein n=1 Tax=Pulveribacter suum TaxID=2116657 RepID=A0A2P1NPQ8_9BURK|nr:hypothetical protein C7H73_05600 [Pulveribacter suum]
MIGSILLAVQGCSRQEAGPAIAFPSDAQIHKALQTQFAQDPANEAARQLVRTLAGERGALRYQVRQVIYRQGAFETRYDAALHLGQPGATSLQALYGTMIPQAERDKLPAQDLAGYEAWLQQHLAGLDKTDAPQAQALRATLQVLGECYRNAAEGSEVVVMQQLAALLSPERSGWFAEKLPAAGASVRCLPV